MGGERVYLHGLSGRLDHIFAAQPTLIRPVSRDRCTSPLIADIRKRLNIFSTKGRNSSGQSSTEVQLIFYGTREPFSTFHPPWLTFPVLLRDHSICSTRRKRLCQRELSVPSSCTSGGHSATMYGWRPASQHRIICSHWRNM